MECLKETPEQIARRKARLAAYLAQPISQVAVEQLAVEHAELAAERAAELDVKHAELAAERAAELAVEYSELVAELSAELAELAYSAAF
jgi:hypothetical protein